MNFDEIFSQVGNFVLVAKFTGHTHIANCGRTPGEILNIRVTIMRCKCLCQHWTLVAAKFGVVLNIDMSIMLA